MSQEQKLQKRDDRTYTTPPPVNRRIIGIPEARVLSTCTVSSTTLLRPTTIHGGVPELMTHQLLESCRNRLSSRRSMSNTSILWTRMTFSPIGMMLQAVMVLLLNLLNLDKIEKRILINTLQAQFSRHKNSMRLRRTTDHREARLLWLGHFHAWLKSTHIVIYICRHASQKNQISVLCLNS
jgi:hypothetical protein